MKWVAVNSIHFNNQSACCDARTSLILFIIFRFIVDLIDSLGGRSADASTESEAQLKKSVINFFASDAPKISTEMEEFEFELLKTELLTQPIEKEGSQLFQRKTSTGSSIKKVSAISCILFFRTWIAFQKSEKRTLYFAGWFEKMKLVFKTWWNLKKNFNTFGTYFHL